MIQKISGVILSENNKAIPDYKNYPNDEFVSINNINIEEKFENFGIVNNEIISNEEKNLSNIVNNKNKKENKIEIIDITEQKNL